MYQCLRIIQDSPYLQRITSPIFLVGYNLPDFRKRKLGDQVERSRDLIDNKLYSNVGFENVGLTLASIEIMNNTRSGIVIFFRSKKGNALLGGKFKSRIP